MSKEDISQARHLRHEMSDDTKVWLAICGVVAVIVLCGAGLIFNYANHQAVLKQAACANPESVACALAVRQ